mgnify:CR=1 FL=1
MAAFFVFMHFVYILYSPSFDRFYVGETTDLELRLVQHNSHFFKSASTSFTNDWAIAKSFSVDSRSNARIVESYIKSMKSKKFIYNLVHDSIFYINFVSIVFNKFNISIY